MYRIALNVAISHYRQESARTRHALSAGEYVLEAPESSDDLRLIYEFIGELDPLNKALILLYLDGHSYQEISDVMGITQTNVATKINRLKAVMKKELGGNER